MTSKVNYGCFSGVCFGIAGNVLRLCDGRIENLIINRDVSAAIAKTLLAAGLSHNTNKNGKLEEI